MKKRTSDALAKIYDACVGAASEYDVFDGFYAGGSDRLLSDFAAALSDLGVEIPEPEGADCEKLVFALVESTRNALEKKGYRLRSTDEDYGGISGYGFTIPSPSGNMDVECPLVFQSWSDGPNVGFIVRADSPDLGIDAVLPVVDALAETFSGLGFSRPKVTADPGPGAGRTAWFVRFGF